jgi:hypothetical protein
MKNDRRSSMSDQRLTDLTILSVGGDILVEHEQVVHRFSKSHKSRQCYCCDLTSTNF